MFIEDLLLPLQRDGADSLDRNEARSILLALLQSIDSRPLSARDRRLLKATVIDFLTLANLRGDPIIETRFIRRFSHEFLPLISAASDQSFSSSQLPSSTNEPHATLGPSITVDEDGGGMIMEPSPFKRGNAANITADNGTSNSSADGDTEISGHRPSIDLSQKPQDGDLSDVLREVPPNLHFVCNIHRHRSTLSTSYRMFLEGTKIIEQKDGALPNTQLIPPATGSPVFLLGSRIRKGGMIQGCSLWTLADSKGWKEKTAIAKIARLNTVYVLKMTSSNMPSPINPQSVIPASVDVDYGSAGAEDLQSGDFSRSTNIGHAAVSVRSKGLDKLIQVHAALTSSHVDESEMVQKLHAMSDVTKQQQLLTDTNYLLLKNRLPMKTAVRGKDIHAVDFGPWNRVNAPSRKNLVLEEFGRETNQWEEQQGFPPIFQLGKVDEDVFAVDFSRISPLQNHLLQWLITKWRSEMRGMCLSVPELIQVDNHARIKRRHNHYLMH